MVTNIGPVFNGCDSVVRYLPNTGADEIFDNITRATTPKEFEKLCEPFPHFTLGHCDSEKTTLLHRAILLRNSELLEYFITEAPYLLERGNITYYGNQTPLEFAYETTFNSNHKIIQILLNAGANVNVTKNETHDTLLVDVALKATKGVENALSLLKILLRYGIEFNPQAECELFCGNTHQRFPGKEGAEKLRSFLYPVVNQTKAQLEQELVEEIDRILPFMPTDLFKLISGYCYVYSKVALTV